MNAAKTWASFTSILDFGCGCGRVTRFLPRGLDVTGLDIDGEAIGDDYAQFHYMYARLSATLKKMLLPYVIRAEETGQSTPS